MSQTKKVSGDYTIVATGGTTVDSALTVTGNLTVTGTTTTLETTNAEITDRQIVLNKGESGAGVTGVYSGIEVERGSVDNAWLVFDESTDTFRISYDGGATFTTIATSSSGSGGIQNVVEDTTPQLGGNLDMNSNDITGTGNIDVTGSITSDSNVVLTDASQPSSISGASILYAAATTGGGTGVHFVDGSTTGELVSKTKAIVFGLIF